MTEPSIPPIDDLELPDGDETRPNRVDSGRGQYRTLRGMTPPTRGWFRATSPDHHAILCKPRRYGEETQGAWLKAFPRGVETPQTGMNLKKTADNGAWQDGRLTYNGTASTERIPANAPAKNEPETQQNRIQ